MVRFVVGLNGVLCGYWKHGFKIGEDWKTNKTVRKLIKLSSDSTLMRELRLNSSKEMTVQSRMN